MYRELADAGHVDSMVAVGTVLLEAIGVEPTDAQSDEGFTFMERAATRHNHAQALYELGCLHYLGSDAPPMDEDPVRALEYFEAAAAQQHSSALFLLAEFLITGHGCASNEVRAIPLLEAAAERGHRMARQYILEYLDADSALTATPKTLAQKALAQLPTLPEDSEHFACFHARGPRAGERASITEMLEACGAADVVVLGECHDDPIAHLLEAFALVTLAASAPEAVTVHLSLEMFDADAQLVLDEYLGGHIREADLLQDARSWANYESDYKPLVEFAKQCKLPVVAANPPRRYVGAVGRSKGVLTDGSWPAGTAKWLPPQPLPAPSAQYLKHLREDPAVAWAIARSLAAEGVSAESAESAESALVLHVCGSFHNLGVLERLRHFRPGAKAVSVIIQPESDCHRFVQSRHGGVADFVVLTDASVRRSHDYSEGYS